MAATLASMCSMPLTSVLLLFELTKYYRILLPLKGAVGLAIWVPSVANQPMEPEASDPRTIGRAFSSLLVAEDTDGATWRRTNDGGNVELSIVESVVDHNTVNEDAILDELKLKKHYQPRKAGEVNP